MDATLLTIGVNSDGVKTATSDLEGLETQAKSTEQQSEHLVSTWKQQASELGKTRTEIMQSRLETLNLSAAQRESAQNAINAIEAYDRQAAALRQIKIEAVALGVAFGVAFHFDSDAVKQFIDYADKLDEIGEKTGTTAQRIGELGFAAQQSDTNLENLVQRLGILADKAQAAAGGSAQAAETFRAMGISVLDADGNMKNQTVLLTEIADKFHSYADGTAKAALAQDLFGRGGRDLIPLLNKGSAGIEELSAKYREFSGDMTEAGKVASDFNDEMNEARSRTDSLIGNFSGPLEKAIGGVAQAFFQASSAGDAFKTVGEGIGVVIKILGAGLLNLYELLHAVGSTLGGVAAAIVAALHGDFASAADIFKDIGRTWKEDFGKAVDGAVNIINGMGPKVATAVGNAQAPILDKTKELHKKVVDEFQKMLNDLGKLEVTSAMNTQQFFQADQFTEAEKKLAQLAASPAWAKLTDDQKQILTIRYQEIAAEERQLKIMQEDAIASAKYAADRKKEEEDFQQAVDKTTQDYENLLVKINEETATIGMTNSQKERYIALTQLQIERNKGLITSDEELAKRQKEINAAFDNKDTKEAQQKAIDDQKKAYTDLFQSIDKAASDTWNNIFEGGTDVFKKLTDTLKSTLLAVLYQMTIRPFIINIVGQVTGQQGLASQFLGGGAGGSGGGIGSLLGGGGNGGIGGLISSGLSAFGLGGTAFGAAAGAGGSAGLATLGIAAEAGAGAVGGLGAVAGAALATLGTVMPVIGIALAIASALGAFSHGGPKSGGSVAGGIDLSTGNATAGQYPGNERYFTPNQADQSLQQPLQTMIQNYTDIAHSLGVTAGTASFALGYDTDPNGKSDSRVSAGAFVNGVQVYNQRDIGVGRGDDAALQDRLTLEAKRALFAALQASDMPDYLAGIFKGVDAATATSDQVDGIIKTAQALKLAVDTFAGLGDKFASLNPDQIKGVLDAFGGVDQFTAAFTYLNANFTTGAQQMALAQTQLNKAFTDLGVAVPKTHQEFLNLVNGLDLTTADGQKLYASLMNLAPAFVAVNGTADQAAQALQKMVDAGKEFFDQNFYSDAEKSAKKLADEQKQVADAQDKLGVSIPTTIEGFRQLIEGLDTSTDAGKAMYDALIQLSPAIYDIANASKGAAATIVAAAQQIGTISVDSGTITNQAYDATAKAVSMITDLTDQMTGDVGDKLSADITLIAEQMTKVKAQQSAYQKMYGVQNEVYTEELTFLTAQSKAWGSQLAAFTILKAQYGDKAGDLLDLQNWYGQEKQVLAGNTAALDAAKKIFDEKWQAILDGTASSVDQVVSQMAKLAQAIRDYLDTLKKSDLSTGSPLEKVAEAQRQYQDLLTKAQTGDTDALQKITQYADSYLQLARQAFASSPEYNKIFDTVYDQLSKLADLTDGIDVQTQAAGGASGSTSTTPTTPIDAAAPQGSPISSQADINMLKQTVEDLNATVKDLLTKQLTATNSVTSTSVDNTKKITQALGSKK